MFPFNQGQNRYRNVILTNAIKTPGIILHHKNKYDLSVIVVNYNTMNFLGRCLASIEKQAGVDFETIVFDNASQDASREMAKKDFPWVKLISGEQNLGFAGANNASIPLCSGQYIYFLNPDTEVKPGAFGRMINFMNDRPDIGLAGTQIVNPDDSFQSSVERQYPGERHAKNELTQLKGEIAWVLGASMIARKRIIDSLGGFDERFFLYGEDADLCLEVRKAGWAIGYIEDAVIIHWGGGSERGNLPVDIWKKKFLAEMAFYEKHYSQRTIDSIKRANRMQAVWRILTLRATLPFLRDKESAMNKLDKYRLTLDFF